MTHCPYCKRKYAIDAEHHDCASKRTYNRLVKFDQQIADMVNAGYSLNYIKLNSIELFNEKMSRNDIVLACNRTNTHMPSISESLKSDITQQQYKTTISEKYGEGITNVSQAQEVKDRKTEVNLERYGVVNQFQREEVKEQSKITMMEKYGVEFPCQLPHTNTGRLSGTHRKISDYLVSIGVEHVNDARGLFKKLNPYTGKNYCPIPDIYIEEKKLVFEVYGDRWHMNPTMFYASDVVPLFDGPTTGEECWEKDRRRVEHIESFGVRVVVLWEQDIMKNFDYIKQLIKDTLNYDQDEDCENRESNDNIS